MKNTSYNDFRSSVIEVCGKIGSKRCHSPWYSTDGRYARLFNVKICLLNIIADVCSKLTWRDHELEAS